MKRYSLITSKRLFFFLATTIVWTSTVFAQPKGNSLLWKIEGKGIQPSYLFGTFHVLPQADFELKEKVKSALASADQLVMELDMDNGNIQSEMMMNAGMKQGMTLDRLLTEEQYQQLDEMLQTTLGAGVEQLKTFKPFMISTLLLKRFIGDQPASFESVISAMAAQQGMEINGLETIAEQMSVFDKISYSDQAKDLVELMEKEEETKELYALMISLYKEEKVHELYEQSAQYFDRPGELELILLNRNEKWIPLFKDLAKEQSTFFGVGAAHLGGKKGLLALLKKKGYKVTAVE
ncbi:MAG: TraB/GumN family protein [Cyclobacteriaceae bacterium]